MFVIPSRQTGCVGVGPDLKKVRSWAVTLLTLSKLYIPCDTLSCMAILNEKWECEIASDGSGFIDRLSYYQLFTNTVPYSWVVLSCTETETAALPYAFGLRNTLNFSYLLVCAYVYHFPLRRPEFDSRSGYGGICGGKNGSGEGFLRVLASLAYFHATNCSTLLLSSDAT
jgi:hypothetical protein